MLRTVALLVALAALLTGRVGPASAAGLMGGAFVYFADSASFTDCRTGKTMPVAMEGEYKALEAAYLARRAAPKAPLYVTVEGAIETRAGMEGPPRPTLLVQRFVAAWPGESCERNRADSTLANTYWKIVELKGEAMTPVAGHREGNLILRTMGRNAVSATVGCNRLMGSFETKGAALTFSPLAGTRMACPPPLDAREAALTDALAATRSFAIAGSALVLYDEARAPLALLQAVALR